MSDLWIPVLQTGDRHSPWFVDRVDQIRCIALSELHAVKKSLCHLLWCIFFLYRGTLLPSSDLASELVHFVRIFQLSLNERIVLLIATLSIIIGPCGETLQGGLIGSSLRIISLNALNISLLCIVFLRCKLSCT